MLNTFPELLAFSLIAPFLIRLILGLLYIKSGVLILKKENLSRDNFLERTKLPQIYAVFFILGVIELTLGLMLIIGLFTQIVSIILSSFAFIMILIKIKWSDSLRNDLLFYILLFVVTLSLLLSGAGIFAFDLPL